MTQDPAVEFAGAAPAGDPPGSKLASEQRFAWWRSDRLWLWLVAIVVAIVRWWPLVKGHGLVGGDLYTYYFPLKAWFADRLRMGELALWNPLIGNGMPALSESQTGVFYPFNLVLYRLLPLGAAYNASLIVHYVLAFGFTGMYLRRLGLGLSGMLLGSMVFVYGWFPPRGCLEWAVVTGCWLPLVLWGVESDLAEPRARYKLATTLGLAVQLLAGHFNLAFITLLVVCAYVALRARSFSISPVQYFRHVATTGLCIVLAIGVAAPQLLASLELKDRSQRREFGTRQQELNYGNIPAWYLPQVIVPWMYYPDVEAEYLKRWFGEANTNQVEAHLYFGLLPLLLAAGGVMAKLSTRQRPSIRNGNLLWVWLFLAAFGLLMVTGSWTSLLGGLPGFGYFTGPGRYGIVTQLAVSIFAAFGIQGLVDRQHYVVLRGMLASGALVCVWFDLYWAGEAVQFARPVPSPPIEQRGRSPIAALLKPTDRVLSKNQNSIILCGAAMLPVYLGIGPAEYFQAPTKLPDQFRWEAPLSPEVLNWLRRSGVTHVIALEEHPDWPVEIVWRGFDPLLHGLLGRSPYEPIWLLRLRDSLGRAYWISEEKTDLSGTAVPINPKDITVAANRVEVRANFPSAARLILTDLDYPGWIAEIDGKATATERWDSMYRSVRVAAGEHVVVWKFRPRGVIWGGIVSVICVVACFAWFCLARRN